MKFKQCSKLSTPFCVSKFVNMFINQAFLAIQLYIFVYIYILICYYRLQFYVFVTSSQSIARWCLKRCSQYTVSEKDPRKYIHDSWVFVAPFTRENISHTLCFLPVVQKNSRFNESPMARHHQLRIKMKASYLHFDEDII